LSGEVSSETFLSVTPTVARFIIPFEATGPEASIVAVRGGSTTSPILRALYPQSIGVFTVLGAGVGSARIYHADGGLVSRLAPLSAGETVTIQAGGLGLVNPAVPNGAAALVDPLAVTALPVQVYFDGREGAVDSAYLEPGTAGVYRVRVTVPEGLPRKFPIVQVQSAVSQSQETSAGGPSLARVSPVTIAKGSDASVAIEGINLPAGALVRIGSETFAGELNDGATTQTLRVSLPARLFDKRGGTEVGGRGSGSARRGAE